MPIVQVRAFTILGEFEQAQAELVGKAVVLADGKAGQSKVSASTNYTACEFRSEVTMEGGQSLPSSWCRRAEPITGASKSGSCSSRAAFDALPFRLIHCDISS